MSIQIQNNLKKLNHFLETTGRGGCTCAVSEIEILRIFKHWVSEKFAGNNVVMVIPGAICWHLTEVAHSSAEPNMRRNAHLGGVPFRRNFTVIVLWGCWWRPPRTRRNVISQHSLCKDKNNYHFLLSRRLPDIYLENFLELNNISAVAHGSKRKKHRDVFLMRNITGHLGKLK